MPTLASGDYPFVVVQDVTDFRVYHGRDTHAQAVISSLSFSVQRLAIFTVLSVLLYFDQHLTKKTNNDVVEGLHMLALSDGSRFFSSNVSRTLTIFACERYKRFCYCCLCSGAPFVSPAFLTDFYWCEGCVRVVLRRLL